MAAATMLTIARNHLEDNEVDEKSVCGRSFVVWTALCQKITSTALFGPLRVRNREYAIAVENKLRAILPRSRKETVKLISVMRILPTVST